MTHSGLLATAAASGLALLCCGCQFDPYTSSYATARPDEKEIVGSWVATEDTLRDLSSTSYAAARPRIWVLADGTIRMADIPDSWRAMFDDGKGALETFAGTWQLSKQQDWWGLAIRGGDWGCSSCLMIMNQSAPYQLVIRAGDPDAGIGYEFRKIAPGQVLQDSDGNSYSVKVMSDGRAWTTTNLRHALPGSYCYGDAESECLRFGRLYAWAAAAQACTRLGAGWRLPTDDEWQQLAKANGGLLSDSDGRAGSLHDLREGGASGFNAVLGGSRNADGSYARLDAHGFYWSATESDNGRVWFYNFGRAGLSRHAAGDKSMAVSVRCVEAR